MTEDSKALSAVPRTDTGRWPLTDAARVLLRYAGERMRVESERYREAMALASGICGVPDGAKVRLSGDDEWVVADED